MRNQVDCRWDVAVLTSMAGFFAIATNRNMGWFYVVFMEEFGIDRRGASWPGSVLTPTLRCSGLLVTVLQKYLPLFWIGLAGSLLVWSSLIACAFVPNIEWMAVMMGFVHGVGSGIMLVSNLVLIMQYFRKYRGIAAGLRLSANPVSAIVFPIVLSTLKDAYGFRGTLLVYGAITMHVTAFCIMLKEPPWVLSERGKQKVATKELGGDNPNRLMNVEGGKLALTKEIELVDISKIDRTKSSEHDMQVPEAEALLADLKQPKSDVSSCNISPILERRCASVRISEVDAEEENKAKFEEEAKTINCYVPLLNTDKQVVDKSNAEVSGTDHVAQRIAQEIGRRISTASSVTIKSRQSNCKPSEYCKAVEKGAVAEESTRDWVTGSRCSRLSVRLLQWLVKLVVPARLPSLGLVLAIVGSMLLDYINAVHLSTIVDYARDKGVSHKQATLTIAYAAGPEILGRVLLPFVADLGWVTRPTLACSSLFALGLLFAVTPETTAAAHIALRALSSVAMAGLLTMKQVLIADNLGTDAVALVSGASGLLMVPVLSCNPMIIGYFRDSHGSYDNLFRIAAGVLLVSAFVFVSVMVSARRRTKATAEAKSDTDCTA